MNRFNEDYNPADPTRGLLDHTNEDDPRLLEAIKEYTAAIDAGKRINRQEFLAKHADIAADLSVCLNSLNFIQTAAAQIPGTPATEPQVHADLSAKPLGDFKLVREIGRGGMGVVYEAVQLSLGRRVAVKVLSLAAALDPRHLQRFKNEAQAAAQLHHTNIVPVYAVGCERSVHFYAMQLIDGQTLADVVRDLRRLANRTPAGAENGNGNRTHLGSSEVKDDSPSPSLSPMQANRALSTQVANLSVMHSTKRVSFCKSIARIGLQAADALEYAHKLGVVHRDIKPANLMLDVTGNLWITDFGLAQFYAADSGLTQTGDLVGTYRYMSPEQASGRAVVLDQRTDIYSLGVTLYEVLTLERAVPGETRDELLHQISNVDPRSPRLIDKTIPQELDTILMKSIAKDPADRYSSAKAMADDLRRFLDDQPILARPPSVFDKAVKWTKRHRAITLTAVLMLAIIASGLGVSTALIARAQAKTKIAYKLETDKAEEAKQAQIRAERSFKQARDAVDFFTNIAAEKMSPGPGQDNQLRKQMLETALLYYQGFLEDHKDDPGTGEALTLARSHVSAILNELASQSELFRRQRSLRLLSEESVQKDLNMSREQVTAFSDSDLAPQNLKWFFDGLSKADSQSPELSSQELDLLRARIDANLKKILNASQLARFQQIYLQVMAPWSFQDPTVEEALALAKDQKDEIQKVVSKYRPPFRGGPPPDGRGPGSGHGPDGTETRGAGPDEGPRGNGGQSSYTKQDAVTDILALLTEEQRETWKALTGEPFTGQVFRGTGRRGGRGGGRAGGGFGP